MKTVLNVAWNELKALFCSPIAWLILIVFSFQTGYGFADVFDNYVQDMATGNSVYDLTARMYASYNGLLFSVQGYLYLYIPLLTMGLMSREFYNGSIKLLYSSPITNTHIVLGKYTAVLVYAFVIILIVFAYVVFGLFTVKDLDLPYVLSGLLGLYLLICSYCAIGLFMSSLTSYQVVAAISTLAVLVFLNFVGGVWQDIPFVKDITYWLSIKGRSNLMINGLIVSDDILYFVIVSALFVVLAIIFLRGKRTTRTLKRSMAEYGGVVLLACICGYITTFPSLKLYCDTTSTQKMSLMPDGQEVLSHLDKRLSVTLYANLMDENISFALPKMENRRRKMFDNYIRFKPKMKLKTVLYYAPTANPLLDEQYPGLSFDERVRALSSALDVKLKKFLPREEIDKRLDLSGEDYRLLWQVEDTKGHTEYIRTFDDSSKYPGEKEISTAFKRLSGCVVKMAFLAGHGERSPYSLNSRGYGNMISSKRSRASLVNNGFDVDTLRIDAEDANIPEDVDIIVMADPRSAFSEMELEKLKNYIDKGGDMIIMGEPNRQAFLNPLLRYMGVALLPGRLVQKTKDYVPDLIQGFPSINLLEWNKSRFRWMRRWNYRHVMPGAVAIERVEEKGFNVFNVLATDSTACWNEVENKVFLDNPEVSCNAAAGECEQSYEVAVALERSNGKENDQQKIFIIGDADWLSNNDFGMRRTGINSDNSIVWTEALRWITNGRYPMKSPQERPNSTDNKIYINPDNMPVIRIMLISLIPFICLLSFIVILVSRKRK